MDLGPPSDRDPDRELRERLELSSDEVRVLKRCNVESFWYRSFPFAAGLSVLTHVGVQKGYISGSPRFGSTPKVLLATLVGYIAGKFAYRQRCAEMIMELPNSRLAEAIRRSQQNQGRPPIPNDQLSVSVHTEPTSDQIEARKSMESPPLDLDDYRKPDLDLSSFQERPPEVPFKRDEDPLKPSPGPSYDDLRRKNREDFEAKRYEQLKRDISSSPPAEMAPEPSKQKKKDAVTNAYGDVWDK